jgi:hypothetical protein
VFIPKREFDKITQLEASEREIEGMKKKSITQKSGFNGKKNSFGLLIALL